MKWEYKIERLSGTIDKDEKILNQLADEGWELVNVVITPLRTGGITDAYLKRLKQS